MKNHLTLAMTTAGLGLFLGGCSSMDPVDPSAQLQEELMAAKNRNSELVSTNSSLQSSLTTREQALEDLRTKLMAAEMVTPDLLPPNAKPGECYARVFTPPVYEPVSKTVVHREASEKIAVTSPQYGPSEERILVREASSRLEVIPAKYQWVEEQVLVKEASERLVVVPAVYQDVNEQVLVRPAYSTWKKGRGPVEKVDDMTGEIMCLVEVPAEYQTVIVHKVVKPATTTTVAIPAEYTTVKRQVMAEAPQTLSIEIPAEYKIVKVNKVISVAAQSRTAVPELYTTVSDEVLVTEGNLVWRPILCETNTTGDVVRRLQSALVAQGYDPGSIDGVAGRKTMSAVTAYQRDKGLPSGNLTIEVLQQLGVLSGA